MDRPAEHRPAGDKDDESRLRARRHLRVMSAPLEISPACAHLRRQGYCQRDGYRQSLNTRQVVLRFGSVRARQNALGDVFDFDRFYFELLKPTVEAHGFTCRRGDELGRGPFIHKTIIEAVVNSDHMIADTANSSPNVWYELGIRHALRSTATILVSDAAAGLALGSAVVSAYWTLGGGWLLDTVGGAIEDLARERSSGAVALGATVVLLKVLASALAITLTRLPLGTRNRRLVLAGNGGVALVLCVWAA